MEGWRDDTKECMGKAIKPNSFATESTTTFTSYNIDVALAEAK